MAMDEQLELVLREMCKVAGADYDEVDFNVDGWWRGHTWTVDQEDGFTKWMVGHLKKSAAARNALMSVPSEYAGPRRQFVDMFLLSYGWLVDKK